MSGRGETASARAAYVHVPFCRHRCGYCNFTVVADRAAWVPRYLDAISRELEGLGDARPVETLFIGGGTPTELSTAALEELLVLVTRWFPADEGEGGFEFSVEANPNDLTEEKLSVLAAAGVNRVSIGGQSFDAEKLRILERDHDAEAIERGVVLAKKYVAAVGLDLIFGVPGEEAATWREDLQRGVALSVDHVSTYGLTFEQGTQFWNRRMRGELVEVDEETSRAMYATAMGMLVDAGYEHYEVSNFARPGRRCRHNEMYWTGGEYYAVGPGAARHVAGRRETNHRSTQRYLELVLAGESPVAESEQLDPEEKARERLVFGLRRMEGVDRVEFEAATGIEVAVIAGAAIQKCVELGLLEERAESIRLTREGVFLSDAVSAEILKG